MEGHNSPTNGQKYIHNGQEYIVLDMSWWKAGDHLYEMRRLTPSTPNIQIGETIEVQHITIVSRLPPMPDQIPQAPPLTEFKLVEEPKPKAKRAKRNP